MSKQVRVLSRGGVVKVATLESITAENVVMLRWPNAAGVWEFQLSHGCQIKKPASEWRWRIHPDEMQSIWTMAEEQGLKFSKQKPPSFPITSQKPRRRAPVVHPRQTSFFK